MLEVIRGSFLGGGIRTVGKGVFGANRSKRVAADVLDWVAV
jgi:hypothetical protein